MILAPGGPKLLVLETNCYCLVRGYCWNEAEDAGRKSRPIGGTNFSFFFCLPVSI
jgi:hypothetical protein